MTRIKLDDRTLPAYSRGEEIFNMVSHIVGGGFGAAALITCVAVSIIRKNYWGLAGAVIYCLMMIFLYTMSSVYHGLYPGRAKKVLQVLDHCTIYALILGTYAPILLTGLRAYDPLRSLVLFCVIFVCTAVGVVFTAIDFKTYKWIAYGGYFVVGWTALLAAGWLVKAFGWPLFLWLLAGGVMYTSGMVFYAVGRSKAYFHSIFHLFILAGTALQFVGIFKYCVLTVY